MKKLTLFSVPKAFEGHTGLIQANAIRSWTRLHEGVEVLLIGDDPGVMEFAQNHQIKHIPEVARNERGTPLLDSVFQSAHENSSAEFMMFVNCDIILTSKLMTFLQHVSDLELEEFLAIGMRTDFDMFEELEFDANWESAIEHRARQEGELASILCKDYFLFRNSQFQALPEFSIGRGNWDSWMVATAARMKIPVIDGTQHIFAGHQNHDYGHVGGRMQAYVSGQEARNNIRLAGGSHYIKGSMATHALTSGGDLKRINRFPLWTMLKDSPRLLKQLYSFILPQGEYSDSRKAA